MKVIESNGKVIIQDGDINLVVEETKEYVEANIQKYIKIIENRKGEL